jgi:predicted dehydrogenase
VTSAGACFADAVWLQLRPSGGRAALRLHHARHAGGRHARPLPHLARPLPPPDHLAGTLTLVGEDGTLEWDGAAAAVTLIRELPTHDYREQHLSRGPVSFVATAAPRDATGGPGSAVSSTMQMVRALVAAGREGRPHPNDLDDNWVSFATAMAAAESARTGRPVRVPAE